MSKGDEPDETVSEVSVPPTEQKMTSEEVATTDLVVATTSTDIALDENIPLGDPEPYIKHPLQNRWALWFFKNEKGRNWLENLKLVTTFDTVEDFWALYNYIQPSSKIPQGCDYNLFKDGIQPMWEDEANRKGGKWTLTTMKQQRNSELDKIWLETLLCLIGEGFGDDSDYVNGAVVQLRPKGDRVSIWTSDLKNPHTLNIGKKYKERLALPKNFHVGFQTHKDSMNKNSSNVKNIYTV